MLGASPGPHPGAAKGTTSLAVSIDDPFGAFEQTEDPADESLARMPRLQHLAMLVHLHVVVNKIICMHERSSIGIWRMGVELEQQQRVVATQAAITDLELFAIAQAGLEMEAAAADAKKGTALRQVQLALQRTGSGKVELLLHVWHRAARMGVYHSMRDALECKMRLRQRDGALRQLRQVLVGIVKGELRMRVVMWQASMKEAKSRSAIARMVCKMAQVRLELEGAAVGAMKEYRP